MKAGPNLRFALRLASFSLITLPSIAMYAAAQAGSAGWIWFLIALTAAGCLLAIAVR